MEVQTTKYAIRNDACGLTGQEYDTLPEARGECTADGDEVVEVHYGVEYGNVVYRRSDKPKYHTFNNGVKIKAADTQAEAEKVLKNRPGNRRVTRVLPDGTATIVYNAGKWLDPAATAAPAS